MKPDWQDCLNAYVKSVFDRPFVYGQHDCGLFVASAVEAMTGVDYAADWRGTYTNEIGLARLLKPYGGLEGLFDSLFDRKSTSFLSTGDIVLMGGAVGICIGTRAAFIGKDGLEFFGRHAWEGGWLCLK